MGIKQLSSSELQIDNTLGMIWLPITGIVLFLFSIGLLFFPQIIGGKGDFLLAGIVVFGMSIITVLLWAKSWIRVKISKSAGTLEVRRILKIENYQVAQIKKVELAQEMSASKSKGRPIIQYFLYFMLENGERLRYQDVTNNQQEASKVAEFICVPFEYRPLPSYSEGIKMTMDSLKSKMEQAQQEYAKKQEGNV